MRNKSKSESKDLKHLRDLVFLKLLSEYDDVKSIPNLPPHMHHEVKEFYDRAKRDEINNIKFQDTNLGMSIIPNMHIYAPNLYYSLYYMM